MRSREDILGAIAEKRRGRIKAEGHSLGVEVPEERLYPLVEFGRAPFLICEVKRRSPSRGDIAPGLDPVSQAGLYFRAGVKSVSVLTEEDHFKGSLTDLMRIKAAYPELALLRKEFILDGEDLEVSYRAGADAVLLIAALLDGETLRNLHDYTLELGMTPLVEVHTPEDADKARRFEPQLVGINSRDLRTFTVDPLLPLERAALLDWEPRLVFESGIRYSEDVRLCRANGFAGALVGETVVRHPERLPELLKAAAAPVEGEGFWAEIARRRSAKKGAPLVKICGLTSAEDVRLADELGADLLGFIFADSPRRTSADFINTIGDTMQKTRALKVAVVVSDGGRIDPELHALLDAGLIDAVQFHGDETPEECAAAGVPYYKALRIGSVADLDRAVDFRSPRVLLDARSAGVRGGSGRRIAADLVAEASTRGPVWLAGGISDENVRSIVDQFHPELIDLASGVESAPGKKDHQKLRRLFAALSEV